MRSKLDNIHDKLNTNFEFLGLFSSLKKCFQDGKIKDVKEEVISSVKEEIKDVKEDMRIIK